ncbi:hypothetical protein [Phaeobacter piscinae]|uniref:hypothetical protein n=1 Tax=Phaeobacter piscinae TaxID=1580596 RepID=UPI000BC00DBB|nr:hypothetical protein [Phaeobacter piscinae]ATG38739.1 hypothetical protein PhaeoP14_00613 [Phaeobacter piscinae]
MEDIFQAKQLDDGQDVLRHLRALLNELSGAPVLHHTEESEPYWVGGSDNGRKVEILIECLKGMFCHAQKTSDWLSAAPFPPVRFSGSALQHRNSSGDGTRRR